MNTKGLNLIITDRKSWVLDEILATLEWQNYGVLAPPVYSSTLEKITNIWNSRYVIYTDPDIIEKAQSVIYIDGLAFEVFETVSHDYVAYAAENYTRLLASLIKAESLGKRIVYISEHNSRTQNALSEFIYYNIGNQRKNEHEQLSNPSIWLPVKKLNKLYFKENKKEEDWENLRKASNQFRNVLGTIIDNFENEIIPVSVSTFARKNKLKDVAIIYNPNNNFSNIEITSAINNLYTAVNFEPLHYNEHQNSSLIDYLKGSENGIAKLIESIIFCIPKLKEMKLQRIKTEKEIELLNEEIRAQKIANNFAEEDNVIQLVKGIFECMDKADNGTKVLLANKLLIERKLGEIVISENSIDPTTGHCDI